MCWCTNILLQIKALAQTFFPFVDNAQIMSCGFTAGNAIRLKHGASQWWDGPEAKQACPPPAEEYYHTSIQRDSQKVGVYLCLALG